ncbi:MAG: hypothetical protein SOW18_01105 [Peptoniphilus sp.]|nr:hypothetical protein [Peptoniphilus sp.]MDY3118118.1 hypothetical protein [Peptoniphilus sp.]
MHDTLLIKTITRESTGFRNIFFQIGDMDAHTGELMDLLNRPESPYAGRCLFRYNGIRLRLEVEEIPTVLALLVKKGVPVYGVYEPYF